MNFKEFQNIVKNTRTTRRFKQNNHIPHQDLIDLIDLARQTSSAKNMQPLKYIAIIDEKIKDEVYKPLIWAAHLTQWDQKMDEKPSAYILIMNDTSIDGFAMIDCGISLQTIMLGATAKGYDSCPLMSIDKIAYKKLFKLSEYLEPMLIIALGIKDENIKTTDVINNDTNYFRDKQDTHCVPKRKLKDILLVVE